MADIFLSYSREDRAAVQPLAEALINAGYSVWWDRNLVGGARYLEETEAELKAAKVVLVVWTRTSIKSHWVADEAAAGRDSQRLLPISLDGSEPPLGFRQYQVIDFSRWRSGDEAAFADLLAALARHAPPSDGTAPRVTTHKLARGDSILRRPLILGGAALAALALIATAASMMMRPQGASPADSPTSQRIAFFGFTATSDDPLSVEIASIATDETYKALNQIGLHTSSRDQTQVVKLGGQLARARELGALYALGGEVRSQGGAIRVSIRLDDAVNGTTIWDVTLTGGEADKVSLPFQATAAATGMADCVIYLRTSLKRENEKTLKLVSRYCDASRRGDRLELAERARELATSAPDSARVQSTFATYLHEVLISAPMSDQPALRKEIDSALKLALDADRNDTQARTLGAVLAIEDGKPIAESESVLLEIVQQNPNDYAAHNWYGVVLRSVGRYDDAVRYFRAANRLRPLDTLLRGNLASGLLVTGQSLEGQKLYEETNARLPTALMWEVWMGMTIAHKLTDLEQVLASAPASVSGDRLACWRDIAQAVVSRDPNQAGAERARACNIRSTQTLAALGDIDAAFEQADIGGAVGRLNSGWWFPSSRPLRADPRLLPLMKETGRYQYWLDTGTHPDICDLPDERNFEICVSLRTDQAAE